MNWWMRSSSVIVVSLAVLSMAWLTGGCETAEGLAGLALDPSEITIGTDTPLVRLSVVGGIATNSTLALPLEWSMSNPALGSITGASGYSATYVRNSKSGQNTVVARDQYGNEGYAAIKQLASASYALVLTVRVDGEETTIIPFGQNTAEITVSGEGAQGPFSWAVTSGNGSIASGQGGSTVVFKSGGVGSSSVQVTDFNGVITSTSVTQADEPEDDGDTGGGDTGGGGGDTGGPGAP